MAWKNEAPPPLRQSSPKRRSYQRTPTSSPKPTPKVLESIPTPLSSPRFNHRAAEFRPGSSLRSHSQSPDIFSSKPNTPDPEDQQYETLTPANVLQSVFGCSATEASIALEANNYDWDNTLNYLMGDKGDTATANKKDKKDIKASGRPVCRYFMEGGCFRKDCKFSHDMPHTICRYWLQGSCLKGDTCEFRHEIDLSGIDERISMLDLVDEALGIESASIPAVTQVKIDDEELFPSLSSPLPSPLPKVSSGVPVSSPSPSPSPSSSSLSFASMAAKKAKNKSTVSNQKGKATKTLNATPGKLRPPKSIPRLETGIAMHKLYLEKRGEALNDGRNRARLLQAAGDAWRKGDPATARKLSTQAKDLAAKMTNAHREAAFSIFQERNSQRSPDHDVFIDLHGLLPDEAIHYLEIWLLQLEEQKWDDIVFVITGVGKHSSKGRIQGSVRTKISEWLRSWGYPHAEYSVEGVPGGGVFAIEIKHY